MLRNLQIMMLSLIFLLIVLVYKPLWNLLEKALLLLGRCIATSCRICWSILLLLLLAAIRLIMMSLLLLWESSDLIRIRRGWMLLLFRRRRLSASDPRSTLNYFHDSNATISCFRTVIVLIVRTCGCLLLGIYIGLSCVVWLLRRTSDCVGG